MGCVEELSNFNYLVFAGIALFRLCVFRSVSVIFIICFEERKLYVNLSKSRLIILLSYYPKAFEQCFGSINWVIEVTCRNRVVCRSFLGEELSNFTYTARQQR